MSEPEPQPSPARQRAEARKQKLLTQGNDRLAKITGAMKGHQSPPTPTPSTQTHQDPPEVDISNLSNTSPSLLPKSSTSNPNSLNQTPSRNHLGAGNDSIIDDSMLEMMKSMGLQLPPGFDQSTINPGVGSHSKNQSSSNSLNHPQEKGRKDWIDIGLGLLALTSIIGIIYKNYASQSILSFQGDSLGITHHPNLRPTPIFWMFMTLEITLQVTRWFFKKNTSQNNNKMVLRTLAGSLPSPYSNLVFMGIRYVGCLDEVLNHFCLLVFGLGWGLVYLDARSVMEFGWVSLLLP